MILLILDDSGWFCLVLTDSILQLSLAFSSLAIISHLSFTTFEKEISAHNSSQNDIICFNLRFPFPPRGQVYGRMVAQVAVFFALFRFFFRILFLLAFLCCFYRFLDRFWEPNSMKFRQKKYFLDRFLEGFFIVFFFDFWCNVVNEVSQKSLFLYYVFYVVFLMLRLFSLDRRWWAFCFVLHNFLIDF